MAGFCVEAKVKEIPVRGGLMALVDDEDEALVSGYNWHALQRSWSRASYARAYIPGSHPKRQVLMHRLILNAPDRVDVDHEDRDGMNNRRYNIRLATKSQNLHNAEKHRTHNGRAPTSRFKGVCRYLRPRGRKGWDARVSVDGGRKYLGTFLTEREAALAYNSFAKNHFGPFARLNNV